MNRPLAINLFGPPRILIDGEPMPHVRSRKAVWLLALLVLRNGRPTSREWVAAALWPDAEGSVGLSNLRPIVSELRRALGAQGERLRSPDRNHLVFDLNDAEVDVLRFDLAVKNGTPEQTVELYTGNLLEGCPEEWSHQERNQREANFLDALITMAHAAMTAGDPVRAASLYSRVSGLDPWRDASRRGQMTALAASGDVNAALQTYRDFAQTLTAEASMAPDKETTALYEKLRAKSRRPARPAAEKAEPRLTGYLPNPPDALIGREDERADVAARLRSARLVTLTGPGGVGKTRLALAVASDIAPDFNGGAWFVPLESLTVARQVPAAVAAALGVPERKETSLTDALIDHLRAKRTLIVLDNCEHLLGACASLAREILNGCGEVRIVTTSREPLGTVGERSWPVPSLAFPEPSDLPSGRTTSLRVALGYESVRLFIERAKSAAPDFDLTTARVPAVVAICSRLDGLPLALELAAARTRSMSVENIAERLDDSLRLLTAGFRAANGRQNALRATLDWSYDLLNAEERTVLQRLSTFHGGFTLSAAESVCEECRFGIAESLGSLVDKSLVVFDDAKDRYRLLETVRQYASKRLHESGDADKAFARHRTWALDFAEKAGSQLKGKDQGEWLAALDADRDNLRAALAAFRADPDGAEAELRLTGALGGYWYLRRIYEEGREKLTHALEREKDPSPARVRALNLLGSLTFDYGDFDSARTHFQTSLELSRALGDPQGVVRALQNLANVQSLQGNDRAARTAYEECLPLYQSLGDRQGLAAALGNLGLVLSRTGDTHSAKDRFEESLALFQILGNRTLEAQGLERLGQLSAKIRDFASAQTFLEESRTLREELGDSHGVAWSEYCLAEAAYLGDDLPTAEERFRRVLEKFEAFSSPRGTGATLRKLGDILLSQGAYAESESHFKRSQTIHQDLGDTVGTAITRAGLGRVAAAQGDLATAQRLLTDSLETLHRAGERRHSLRAIFRIADVTATSGALPLAVRLWAAAESERNRSGEHLPPIDETTFAEGMKHARRQMGEEFFAAEWALGESLDWPTAVAIAIRSESGLTSLR